MSERKLSERLYPSIRKQKLIVRVLFFLILLLSSFFIKNHYGLLFLGLTQLGLFLLSPSLSNREKISLSIIPTIFIAFGVLPILIVYKPTDNEALLSFWQVGITRSSLDNFIYLFLRCFSGALSLLLFLQCVPLHELFKGMRKTHISSVFVDLMEQVYKNIVLLFDTANQILTAQKSRLGYLGARNKLRHSAMLIGRTFVLAINEAELHYEGLLSRSFFDKEQWDKENGTEIVASNHHQEMKTDHPLIELQNIHFSYPEGKEAVKGVSFKAYKKEKIAFIGANGSGKSSFFMCLNGLHQPQKGDYYYNAEKMDFSGAQLRNIRRNVGLVFQNSNTQIFTASVRDELAFGLENIGVKGDELNNKVDALIAHYKLEKLLERAPYKLSEGEKKWVNIAAILAIDPQVVVLDEPSSFLDFERTEQILALTEEWIEEGKTVILSTHDMNLVYRWADRVVLFSEGEIIGEGTPDEIFANKELMLQSKQEAPLQFSIKEQLKSKGLEAIEFVI